MQIKTRLLARLAATVAMLPLVIGLIVCTGVPTAAAIEVGPHPRLVLTAADFSGLDERLANTPYGGTLRTEVVSRAEDLLSTPTLTREFQDEIRMLGTSRTALDRSFTLGMAYKITGDTRFSSRLWKELDAVTRFSDWNPDHFLDTAEMATAVAIGFDWINDTLSTTQRQQIVDALKKQALDPARRVYTAAENSPGPFKYGGNWANSTSNWNVVVNSAMAITALAIRSESPTAAEETLQFSLASVKRGLSAFGPDGGYSEGFAYWEYASRYASLLILAMRSATGDDAGLADAPGLQQTGTFALHNSDNAGNTFNFGDSQIGVRSSSAILGLAAVFSDGMLRDVALRQGDLSSPGLRSAFLGLSASSPVNAPSLDAAYSPSMVASMRSSWTDPNATVVGLRTGAETNAPHQDLDAGTFFLSALGEVWADELGPDNYGLSGYFDDGLTGTRWDYYRKRAEGQNTLLLDPYSSESPRRWASRSEDVRSSSNETSAFTVADLSGAYAERGYTWQRGAYLSSTRNEVIIQDEVTVPGTVEGLWSMHTRAQVRLSDDRRSATLYMNGKTLQATITSPSEATFTVMDAVPLPTAPAPTQTPNSGITKLAIPLEFTGAATVSVHFAPAADGASAPREITPLGSWSLGNVSFQRLTTLAVGGQSVPSFSPGIRSYSVAVDPTLPVPLVTATGTAGTQVAIDQAAGVPGLARITVGSPDQGSTYVVRLVRAPRAVASAAATHTTHGSPNDTFDADLGTYWGTWGDRTITWDLGSDRSLRAVETHWKPNESSRTKFEVEISRDGKTWSRTHDAWARGRSVVTSSTFPDGTSARFVRLQVHGDTTSDLWTGISNIRFLGWNPAELNPPAAPVAPSYRATGVPASISVPQTAVLGIEGVGSSAAPPLTDVRFVSSDSEIVQIDDSGRVTARGAGVARVGALIFGDGVTKSVSVTVTVTDPTRIRIYSSGDSYVQGGATASRNYGGDTGLLVKPTPAGATDNGSSRYAYAAFNLAPLRGKTVVSASLSMRGTLIDGSGQSVRVDAATTSGNWSEDTLTFANRPALGSVIGSATFGREGSYQPMNITDHLAGRVSSGAGWMHLGFTQDPNTPPLLVLIDSEESLNKPYIDVIVRPDPLPIKGSYATYTSGGSAAATYDKNLSTSWETTGSRTITWEITNSSPVKSASIHWKANSSKRTEFQVQVSPDGSRWSTQYTGAFVGESARQDIVFDSAPESKFVRFNVYGDNSTDRRSIISEVAFYNHDISISPTPPPALHLGSVELTGVPKNMTLSQVANFSATARATTGAQLNDAPVAVTSDNTGILSVNGSSVTAAAPGTATLTATSTFNGVTKSVSVTVTVTDPTRIRIYSSGDSYVQGGATASRNYGGDTGLLVKPTPAGATDNGSSRYAYAAFNLAPLRGKTVVSASLSMRGTLIDGSGQSVRVDAATTSGNWSEDTLTFANRPALGSVIGSATFGREGSYQPMNITDHLAGRVSSGAGWMHLGFTQDPNTPPLLVLIDSEESLNKPYIDVIVRPDPLPIKGSYATYTSGGSAAATYDKNLSTSWETTGSRTITWEITNSSPVKSASIHWKANSSKRTEFQVQVSPDGSRWSTQYTGAFVGESARQDIVFDSAPESKFVRFNVYGDNSTDRRSIISEVAFYNHDISISPTPPPALHLGSVELTGVPKNMTLSQVANFSATARATTGAQLNDAPVAVTSDNTGILSVNGSSVTAAAPGTATLTATSTFNGVTKSVSVTVTVTDPTRIRIYSSGDSYVQGGATASRNYGGDTGLLVKPTPAGATDNGSSRYAYAAFNLAPLRGKTVVSASLSMRGTLIDGSGQSVRVDAATTSGNWSEDTLTFANRPALGSVIGSATFGREGSYQPMNITDHLAGRVSSGAGWMHLGFTQDPNTPPLLVLIDSEESLNKPYIDVIVQP